MSPCADEEGGRGAGDGRHDARDAAASGRWRVAAGAFLIQLFVPTVFAAYGVLLEFLLRNQDSDALLSRGLFPPILHITARSFLDPVFSDAFSGQSTKTKTIAVLGVLTVAGSIATNMITDIEYLQIFTFGLVGGISTSIVVAQADAVLLCHFPAHRGLVQVLNHLALAVGHFGIPLLVNGLILSYGIHGSIWLYSGTVLHGLLGASLLCPPRDNGSGMHFPNRPRSHTMHDIELRDFSSNEHGLPGRSPLLARDRSWKNPAFASDSTRRTALPWRLRTTTGVDILPEIPEESDEGSGSDQSDTTLSPPDGFRGRSEGDSGASEKSLQKWRNAESEPESLARTRRANLRGDDEPADGGDARTWTSSASDVMRSRRLRCGCARTLLCACCSDACLYDVFVAVINVPNTLHFSVLQPLVDAARLPSFFPAAALRAVSLLSPALFAAFVPTLVRRQLRRPSPQEGAFSLVVAAFGALCFLLCSPCVLRSRARTKRAVYFVGSALLAAGLYIVSATRSHGVFALGCTFFGVGHGATLGTSSHVLEETLGVRHSVRVRGPLGFLSGCFILFSSVLLGFTLREGNGLNKFFVTLSAFQTTTNIFLLLSYLKTCLQSRWAHLHHVSATEWQPTGSFLTPD